MNALPFLFLAVSAGGSGEGNEAQMARCAWTEAASTSATLVARAKFDRRYAYNADGSPTVGPLMRIRAACWGISKEFPVRSGKPLSVFDGRKFLKLLASAKPASAAPDRFAGRVLRCEFQFLDAAAGAAPAAIVWTFETADGTSQEIQRSEEYRGFATRAEVLAALASGNTGAELLKRANAANPARVTTIAAGTETGKAFAVDTAAARRSCRIVKSDGSYEDA